MTGIVTYAPDGDIARIVMDDGKVNVMSIAMLEALHAAFDEAGRDGRIVALSARGRAFSAGFDLNVFKAGDAQDIHRLLNLGAELALKLLTFPRPVVAACNGAAFPMGAFLIMSSDFRIAAEGDYRIGMNEVAIGLTPPRFAIEVARQRLTPAYFSRTVVNGEMFAAAEAVTAGFFDRIVPAADLQTAATETATRLAGIDLDAHAGAKLRARAPAIAAIREAIDTDLTLAYAEDRVARRDAAA